MRFFQRRGYWYVRRGSRDVSLRSKDRGEAERNYALLIEEENKERGATITMAELYPEYAATLEGRRSHNAAVSYWRCHLGEVFGYLRPDGIPDRIVAQYEKDKLAQGLEPGTVRSHLQFLRFSLSYARKKRLCLHPSHIPITVNGKPRAVWLTREEARRLVDAARLPHIKLAILLMLHTAARHEAICELRWEQVDFEAGLIDLGGRGRQKRRAVVPMNRTLRAALQDARQGARTPYVVEWAGQRVKRVSTAFETARVAAGVPHVTPHDVRRSAARFLVEAGVQLGVVSALLGHTNTRITEAVYARFSPQYLRNAVEALEDVMPRERKKG